MTVESFVATQESLRATLDSGAPGWLAGLRRSGIERFAALGYPTRKDEDWKYTDVSPIAGAEFAPAVAAEPGEIARIEVERLRSSLVRGGLCRTDSRFLVFIDGVPSRALSDAGAPAEGIHILTLKEALRLHPELLEQHLGRLAAPDGQAFTALNTAFLDEGAFVHLEAGRRLAEPLHLVFVSTGAEKPLATHPRVLIVAGPASEATVVETYVGVKGARYFNNTVTELIVGEAARLDHYKLQQESVEAYHVGRLEARLESGARLTSFSYSMGAAICRNDANALFTAAGGHCALNGLYMARGRQHVDNHTLIDHAVGACTSRENYKGVLDQHGRGVFNGKVIVRPDAQKSDAQQSNKNLLLSEGAVIDTKPQLEIFADDVKAAHGAAVGQLDADALFYLRSRGIGHDAARGLLTFAFASEIVETVRLEPVRARLEGQITGWLQTAGHEEAS